MNLNSRKLSLIGTLSISITSIAPTGAMAFNTPLVARFAKTNTPLSFIFGAFAILLIGGCFAMMAHQTSQSGSVYAYNRKALGERAGFVTGWILMLVYICGGAGFAGESANFVNVFLNQFNVHIPVNYLAIFLIIFMWIISLVGIKVTSIISLVVESISILIVLVLCSIIIIHGGQNGLTTQPITHIHSISGISQGIVYVIICFAGFEESTTLTARIQHPKKIVPLTIIISIISVALFFILVSYTEVMGFGLNGMNAFMNSASPLNDLATAYAGKNMATIIDLATMISAVASFLGIMNACSYMFYALAKQHYLPKKLSYFPNQYNSPHRAVNLTAIIYLILYLLIGIPFGSQAIYSNLMDIAGIGFMLVYILVCVGVIAYFKKQHRFNIFKHGLVPILSIVILLFPLFSSLAASSNFPMNLYPIFIIVWVIVGTLISKRISSIYNQE
ncbi:amino acid transporter [Philodulcilactobacillus myokoensis]|uniref:Amino acid transporter n=1 Tax=Philodulcilactobacillus myokoensis TaxID=2929573 RepID=A0A9W6B1Z2_9LACO|nr:APC family permease [Philodulcilactobacillus myokoensis]GLB46649.1 amino acid transporter [Philodulcilactobacillus myokoensis]